MVRCQDLCVGDFWETQERRAITAFTTPVAVDRFLLVTTAKQTFVQAMFSFMSSFRVNGCACPISPSMQR